MDAGPGIEPGSRAYETRELPLLYPAIVWWRQQDSNLPPDACKAPALPDELYPLIWYGHRESNSDLLVKSQLLYH